MSFLCPGSGETLLNSKEGNQGTQNMGKIYVPVIPPLVFHWGEKHEGKKSQKVMLSLGAYLPTHQPNDQGNHSVMW